MAVDVTLSVPQDMMQLAHKVATDANVSVETVLLDWLYHPIQKPDDTDLESLKKTISKYNPIQLWTVVYRDLSAEKLQNMNSLIADSKRGNLSKHKQVELDDLLHLSNEYMVLRAKALLTLQNRGFDVSHHLNMDMD
ncbi:MAG: hypothetical protein Q9P44_06515 [Anaerolineae bacterium]|nr:hypothetical protein [Anaerolineae bacterium]